MKEFLTSFIFGMRMASRGSFLPVLLALNIIPAFAVPYFLRTDGTLAGEGSLFSGLSLGTNFAITAIAVLGASCGAFASERAAGRLPQQLARRAPATSMFAGRLAALALCGFFALAAGALTVYLCALKSDYPMICRRHHEPVLEDINKIATSEYSKLLETLPALEKDALKWRTAVADPSKHPEDVRDMRLMENAELFTALTETSKDEYIEKLKADEMRKFDSVEGGKSRSWTFEIPQGAHSASARLKFTSIMTLRLPFNGKFSLTMKSTGATQSCSITNYTQSVIEIPFVLNGNADQAVLEFENTSKVAVALRPRMDLSLMINDGTAAGNLFRAVLEMSFAVAALAAFGLFLSTAFSKPVALFTAACTVLMICIAPSTSEIALSDSPGFAEKTGFYLSKAISSAIESTGEFHPVEMFSDGRKIEWTETAFAFLRYCFAVPAIFAFLGAFSMRAKPYDN